VTTVTKRQSRSRVSVSGGQVSVSVSVSGGYVSGLGLVGPGLVNIPADRHMACALTRSACSAIENGYAQSSIMYLIYNYGFSLRNN